jgi:hypothetical protein
VLVAAAEGEAVSTSKQRYRRRQRAQLGEERFILFGVELWLRNMHKSPHTLPGEWERVYAEYARRFPRHPRGIRMVFRNNYAFRFT